MSSATTSDSYPRTLREQAFELYCSGLRSPAIAKGRTRLAELDALLAPERGPQSPLSAPADPDFAADDDDIADTETEFPAESATASDEIPAESATTSDSPFSLFPPC